ncbi:MAG: sigma-70 family RNA polymerase sigma factor [Kibdelosporangium sp.]
MARFEDLVQTHNAAMIAYATRLTGDRHTAEDVVQEAWLRAWRRLGHRTGDIGSIRAWLMRVTHNAAMDVHRARSARPTEVTLPEQDLERSTTVVRSLCDEVDTRIDVTAVLDELPPVHRDTLVAVYFADRTAKSAASVLGIPVGTVKSRVHNALHVLRGTLPPELDAA